MAGTVRPSKSSGTRRFSSSRLGCCWWAEVMNGATAPLPLASAAIVPISKLLSFSSSRSPCHTGRSNRQLHQDAQKSRNTFLPRRSDKACMRPDRSGSVNSGANRDCQQALPCPGGGSEIPDACVFVVGDRLLDQTRELGEVELIAADHGLTPRVRDRHANLVLADALGFELPATDGLELGKRHPEVVAS